MLFAELTYTLATEEAERIGVDHVARMTATGSGENSTGKRVKGRPGLAPLGGGSGCWGIRQALWLKALHGYIAPCPSLTFSSSFDPVVAEHLIAQHSAIKMLHSRVKLILEYVKATETGAVPGWGGHMILIQGTPPCPFWVRSRDSSITCLLPAVGEIPFNHEILREAYALCHCLPVLSTDKFKTDFYDVSAGGGAEEARGQGCLYLPPKGKDEE